MIGLSRDEGNEDRLVLMVLVVDVITKGNH